MSANAISFLLLSPPNISSWFRQCHREALYHILKCIKAKRVRSCYKWHYIYERCAVALQPN